MALPPITLLFDGACPLCKREMAFIKRLDKHDRVGGIDITDPTFDPARFGTTHEQVHARIHGVLGDGTLVEGVEVFRRAYREIGLGWMVGWTAWPVARPVVDAMYRWFARNRHRLTFRRNPCADGQCVPHPKG